MATEQGLYAQVFMICRRNLDDIKEKYKTKHLTSKGNQQEQSIGLILIMSGWKKILWLVNPISIKKYMILKLGVIQHTTIKKLE